jgi:hypothetical protein
MFGWENLTNISIDFYIKRGWFIDQAKQFVKDIQSTNGVVNVANRKNITEVEAAIIVDERTAKGINSAIENGIVDLIEAASKKAQQQSNNFHQQVALGIKPQPINSTSIQYYLNQGMTTQEAAIALSNRQRTFSLDKCIANHGAYKGTEICQARQDKWLATMNAKTDEEKSRIISARINNGKFVSQESIDFLVT